MLIIPNKNKIYIVSENCEDKTGLKFKRGKRWEWYLDGHGKYWKTIETTVTTNHCTPTRL